MSIESNQKIYKTLPHLRADHPLRTGKPVKGSDFQQTMLRHSLEQEIEKSRGHDHDRMLQAEARLAELDREDPTLTEINEIYIGTDIGGPDFTAISQVKAWAEETTGARREKLDALPYDLVPYQEITEAFTRVAEHGAQKYEAWNWSKGLARVQLLGSLLRHVFAYLRGKDYDDGPKGSGLLHTDHILWNAAVLSHNVHWNLEDGRRPEPVRPYHTTANQGDA